MKIGMLFPGYGSQFVGMAKELYDHSRIVQEYFEQASHCLDINFVKLCFASSDAELSKIEHAYPSLFLVGAATAAIVQELGVPIQYVAGHGIGEYAALCAAGGINFPDGLYLLAKLSHFYNNMRQDLDVKSVLVNGLPAKKLEDICKKLSSSEACAQIAIYETKTAHIVTGHTQAVDAVAESAENNGARRVKEADAIEGYHSSMLSEVLDQLKIYLTKVDFKDLRMPLISSVHGKEVVQGKKAQDMIMCQIIKPVYWTSVLKQFADADIIIVPAPSKTLVTEVKSYYPEKTVIGIETLSDIDELKKILNIGQADASSEATEQSSEETQSLLMRY